MRLNRVLIIGVASLLIMGGTTYGIKEVKDNEIKALTELHSQQLSELELELWDMKDYLQRLQGNYDLLEIEYDRQQDELDTANEALQRLQKDNLKLKKDLEAKKSTPKPLPSRGYSPYKNLTVVATAYVSFCDTGCIGITARGTNVKTSILHPTGYPIVAVDPRVIPLGSIVEIDGKKYIADDTGGAIKGNKIDILVDTHDTKKAFAFGRQTIDIKVYRR